MKSDSSFNLQAGSLALNFTNTVDERPQFDSPQPAQPTELLTSPERLLAWCAAAHVLAAGPLGEIKTRCEHDPRFASRLLHQAIALREDLFPLFLRLARGADLETRNLANLNQRLAQLPARTVVRRKGAFVMDWDVAASDPLKAICTPIVHDAATLVTSPSARKIKVCAATDCGWLFIDTSKSGRRRWCDMSDCGNREKQRRFRRADAEA
jgi:predicted RNA-binding Zn ribbon-like protein